LDGFDLFTVADQEDIFTRFCQIPGDKRTNGSGADNCDLHGFSSPIP
jgi:hypothetical protein